MKTSNILAAAALSLIAVAGAHAETYEGVHSVTSGYSRADVAPQAAAAAREGNIYADGATANRHPSWPATPTAPWSVAKPWQLPTLPARTCAANRSRAA